MTSGLPLPDVLPRSSWAPLDLRPILEGHQADEAATLLRRTDGRGLLYPGRVHTLVGEPSGGKTWAAVLAVAQVLRGGGVVLVIDLEDSPRLWIKRLRQLGVRDEDIAHGLRYVRPSERIGLEGAAALRPVLDEPPALFVVDATTGALALHGLDGNRAEDVESLYRRLLRPLSDCGAAGLLLDHVVKSRENRGRWALGSERKMSALDGCAYVLDTVRPFGRGRDGLARIVVAKDRPGTVGTPGDVVAELHLSDVDDAVHAELRPVAGRPSGPFRPTTIMQRISEALAAQPAGLSKRSLRAAVHGRSDAIDLGLELLISEGFVAVETGPRSAQMHKLVRDFIAEDVVPDA